MLNFWIRRIPRTHFVRPSAIRPSVRRPSTVGNAFLNRLYTATLTHSDQSHGTSQSLIVNEASYLDDIADVTSVSDDRDANLIVDVPTDKNSLKMNFIIKIKMVWCIKIIENSTTESFPAQPLLDIGKKINNL